MGRDFAEARNRQLSRLNSRVEWFGEWIRQGIRQGMQVRVRFAAQYLRDKTVFNISTPVTKRRSGGGRTIVSDRSMPGEFPRADTTRLMKDIYIEEVGTLRYMIGTTLDYGLYLETRMNRSFLIRTLNEEADNIRMILTVGRGVTGDNVIFNDRSPGSG